MGLTGLLMRLLGGGLLRESLAQARRAALFYALALVFLLVAVLGLLGLGWLVLTQHFGPMVATLTLLAVSLILGLVSLILGQSAARRSARPKPKPAALTDPATNPLAALVPKSMEQAVATAFLVTVVSWLVAPDRGRDPKD